METWIYIIISIVAGLAAGCVLMKLFAARKETQLGVACAKAEAQAGHLAEQLAAAQERLAKDLAAQKADFEERLDDLTKNYEGRLDGLAKDYEKRLAEQKKTFDEEKDLLRQDHAMDLRRQGDAFKETAEKLKAEVNLAFFLLGALRALLIRPNCASAAVLNVNIATSNSTAILIRFFISVFLS